MVRIAMLFAKEFNPHPAVYRQAKSLMDAGHDVTIYAWDRSGRRPEMETVEGVKVVNISVKAPYGSMGEIFARMPLYYLGLLKALKPGDYDALHCYDQYTLPIGVLLSKLHGKPLVFDVLDIYYLDFPDGFLRRSLSKADRFLARFSYRIKVPCDYFGEYYGMKRKTTVVYNCPEKDRFKPVRKEHDGFVVGHFGNIRWTAPFEMLFRAVKGMERVRVVIGGEGIYMDRLREMAGGNGSIEIRGFVPVDKVPERYRTIDALYVVYPKNHAPILYSVPMKIFEAMACGIPVIVNDVGFTAEFVKKHEIGLIVDGDDPDEIRRAIARLRDDENLRKRLGENGRRLVEQEYNWENMVKRLLKIYENMEKDL